MLDYRMNTFIDLCETKNYTLTAEHMCISQPTVSLHIKYLEEQYGTKLFTFVNRQLVLTAHGEQLYRYALSALTNATLIESVLSSPTELKRTLHIGSLVTVGETILLQAIKEYLELYPSKQINLIENESDVLLTKLKNGQISLAVVDDFFDATGFHSELFFQDNTICFCVANHPLANKKVNFSDLYKELLVYREYGSCSMKHLQKIMAYYGEAPTSFERHLSLGSLTSVKSYVRDHGGIGFLYRFFVKDELEKGNLAQIHIENFNPLHFFQFVWSEESPYQSLHIAFMDICKSVIRAKKHLQLT